MGNKLAATDFLSLIVEGNIAQAYERHVAHSFHHHNAFFAPDAASLRNGMEENHQQFPSKKIIIKHIVAEGDLVVVHSHLQLEAGKEAAVVHLLRFENGKIVELWDVSQAIPANAENSMF